MFEMFRMFLSKFQDNWYAYEDKYQLNPAGYVNLFSEAVQKGRTRIMRGGRYSTEEAWGRAACFEMCRSTTVLAPLVGRLGLAFNSPEVLLGHDTEDVVMAAA